MSTTRAQPQGALEMEGRSILWFHLGKHEGRAAHRIHGADLVNILEQV